MIESRETSVQQPSWEDLGETWEEALERLEETSPGSELVMFTARHGEKEIEEYLAMHDSELSPEEKFFLQMSLEAKRFKK